MFAFIKRACKDLIMWGVNRLKYNLFFLFAYWKLREDLYVNRKYQTFIILFWITSLLWLFVFYFATNHAAFFSQDKILTFFYDAITFLSKPFNVLHNALSRWYEFIAHGSNLAVFIGFIISLYCFIFNEQNEIVSASTTISDWRIIPFILFVSFPNLLSLVGYKVTEVCLGKFLYSFLLITTFWVGLWFVFHIINLINRINVVKFFEYIVNCYKLFYNAIILVFALKQKHWEKVTNSYCESRIFDGFIHSIASVYQILNYLANHELLGIFQKNYQKWREYRYFLNFSKTEGEEDADVIKFIEERFKRYEDFYQTSIRCQYTLIRALYDKGFITEGYEAVKDYFSMSPYFYTAQNSKENIKKLDLIFLTGLSEITLYFYNNGITLLPILTHIKGIVTPENLDNVITIYRIVLIKASEKQDVKTVISLCYDLMQTAEQAHRVTDAPISSVRDTKLVRKERYMGRILYIYLSLAIKSIELGYKDIVSFIVKFVVSEFKTQDLNRVFLNMQKKLPEDQRFDSNEIGKHIGISNFNINNKTYQYCFEKLIIMLYGQQLFIKQRTVHFNTRISDICSIKGFLSGNYLYVFDKLCADPYNLLWMKNDQENIEFRSNLRERLKTLF